MSDDGWIKIHRKTLRSPVVMKDAAHLAVWVWLLLHATRQPYDTIFSGRRITLEPGQLVAGRKKIAGELGLSESRVYRIINELKIEQQLEQRPTPGGSVFTITNWHKYQEIEQPTEQRANNERTLYKNTKNNKRVCKSVNNTLGDKSPRSLSDYDPTFEDIWRLTPKHDGRLDGKKPAYAAYKRSLKAGHTPEEIRAGIEALARRYEEDQTPPRYIPKGSTIYSQERWADALADTGKSEIDREVDEMERIIEEGLADL